MPQDAIEPIRRMCKWIVDEECDPEVVIPLWRLGQQISDPPVRTSGRAAQERTARTHPGRGVRFVSQSRCFSHQIDEICERADIASRTFFNHFPTRQDMVRALAESRLVNLHDVVFARSNPSRSRSG